MGETGRGGAVGVGYPAPDWAGAGRAVRVESARDRSGGSPAGWLVHQGSALAWLPVAEAGSEGSAECRFVEEMLRSGARQGRSAADEWRHVLTFVLHDTPRDVELAQLLADVRSMRRSRAASGGRLPWRPSRSAAAV